MKNIDIDNLAEMLVLAFSTKDPKYKVALPLMKVAQLGLLLEKARKIQVIYSGNPFVLLAKQAKQREREQIKELTTE